MVASAIQKLQAKASALVTAVKTMRDTAALLEQGGDPQQAALILRQAVTSNVTKFGLRIQ